jgi:hypothetical protein
MAAINANSMNTGDGGGFSAINLNFRWSMIQLM